VRLPIAVAAAIAVVGLLSPACSKDAKVAFCDELRDTYRLTELRDAIDRNDIVTIKRSLQRLEDLADDAPKEIAIDLHIVVDTVVQTVRRVTGVPGPGGETMPPDLGKLNEALAHVAKSSQHVAEFAEQKCGLTLSG